MMRSHRRGMVPLALGLVLALTGCSQIERGKGDPETAGGKATTSGEGGAGSSAGSEGGSGGDRGDGGGGRGVQDAESPHAAACAELCEATVAIACPGDEGGFDGCMTRCVAVGVCSDELGMGPHFVDYLGCAAENGLRCNGSTGDAMPAGDCDLRASPIWDCLWPEAG